MKQAVRPYLTGQKVTAHMRAVIINWLIEVHSHFQMVQETLFLTVAIFDRFLQVRAIYNLFDILFDLVFSLSSFLYFFFNKLL